jgi:dolichol-phosphate mannosyltransferase
VKLCVVIPIFNEQDNLPELRRRLAAALDAVADASWQVIYVNDGSRDSSAAIIEDQHRQDPRFTLVDLSRNFGHQAAITAGLAHADGDAVVVMDGDMQDPPELIPELVQAWREGGRIVLAERKSRAESGPRRAGFELFHLLFRWLSDFPIPPNTGVFGLMDRCAVRELLRLPESHRFLPGLRSWIGFEQRTVRYDRVDRSAGEPKQTFRRLARYAMDAVFSFSYKPLRLMTAAGLLISAAGFALACLFILKRLFGVEEAQTGFTTLVSLVLFMGGIQLIAIGLLGEYLGRMYDEVKRRPHYIVRRSLGVSGQTPSP